MFHRSYNHDSPRCSSYRIYNTLDNIRLNTAAKSKAQNSHSKVVQRKRLKPHLLHKLYIESMVYASPDSRGGNEIGA